MIYQSLFGIVVLILIAWLLGENRRAVSWRVPVAGLALQFALGACRT
uniref:Na+ dependent nucleoside transporter N-terminus n=1 Tax=Candidatus Kentrum sp. DK TaxID=2126562 RepID=A0A450T149_9GAMM|nr:MAG: Na+ dependent nucleoside transporter N-terminus [Candidatus Kentron sp. DK]VFJ60207.1 MAG: Na+ dependent nucleoside transporter N-terminus [Candidatus Kentron sp. DK]